MKFSKVNNKRKLDGAGLGGSLATPPWLWVRGEADCAQRQGSAWQSEEKDLSAVNESGGLQQQRNKCAFAEEASEVGRCRHLPKVTAFFKGGSRAWLSSCRAGAWIPDCPDENAQGSAW